MSTWESEMTPKEWEGVMGVPYSHISPEEQVANLILNNKMKKRIEWCTCNLDTESAYTFHVPGNRFCSLCKSTNERQDHYHCGVCGKLTQVG